MIRICEAKDIPILNDLFTQATGEGLPFKTFDIDTFTAFFLSDRNGVCKQLLLYEEEDQIQGFISGCAVTETNVGYITFLYVKPGFRRKGLGTELLKQMEFGLAEVHPGLEKYEISFYNPMQFPWWISEVNGPDHPCAPGQDMSAPAFLFFKNHGYRCYAYQNSYYQPLQNYTFPKDIESRIEALKAEEIEITFYDPAKHIELAELFDNIKNPGWKKAILDNESKGENAKPLLVAVYQDKKVIGYTGPLSVSESGRGCFHGIGVHTDFRKKGIGKILFSRLCLELQNQGASFMSLYTGEDNPARNIYEAVGFRVVRCWADMRKIRIR